MKISASITDFPLLSLVETSFKKFQEAGVDGVEIVLGIKSRWQIRHIQKLSHRYNLPITSIHQPPWSWTKPGFFDEQFVEWAKELGTRKVVFHPLGFYPFGSKQMNKYFARLSQLQQTYDISVLLENMPKDFMYKKLYMPPYTTTRQQLDQMNIIADTYGLSLTFDVSHSELIKPQNETIFQKMLPKIGNIHLSSFREGQHHLPLNLGKFDSTGFLTFLEKKKYKGLITLEVYYPHHLMILGNHYDFTAITKSVQIFRDVFDKSL